MKNKIRPVSSGRPREFDIENAVADAVQVFWNKGYAGSSLPDLLEGMNLTRGSFYKAFGDKRSLFIQALNRYSDTGAQETRILLQQEGSAIESIRQSLLRVAKLSQGENGRRGCLLIAAATELASHDDEIAETVRKIIQRLQKLYMDAIKKGQLSGEINPGKDCYQLARLLVNQIEGMRVVGKVDDEFSDINEMVELTLTILR